MFYEVRIKRADGSVKKVVSKEKLNKIHWENFWKSEEAIGLVTSNKVQVPTWVKQKLDVVYPETPDMNQHH